MRFERYFTISLEAFNSFYSFIEEQLIGYEAHRNDDGTATVTLIFSINKKEGDMNG